METSPTPARKAPPLAVFLAVNLSVIAGYLVLYFQIFSIDFRLLGAPGVARASAGFVAGLIALAVPVIVGQYFLLRLAPRSWAWRLAVLYAGFLSWFAGLTSPALLLGPGNFAVILGLGHLAATPAVAAVALANWRLWR